MTEFEFAMLVWINVTHFIFHLDLIPETTSEVIEISDKIQLKRSPKTLILDAIVLPNLQIICITSVCCDLRFYDTSASKCNLKLYIRNFPEALCEFFYHCSTVADKNSKLIFGDCVGTVRVIDFTKNFKYSFRQGTLLHQLSYNQLMKVYLMSLESTDVVNQTL